MEGKEKFWSELDRVVESIPREDRVVLGADIDGHVGEGSRGDEEMIGRFGVKGRNLDGRMVMDFVKGTEMTEVNTFFKKGKSTG